MEAPLSLALRQTIIRWGFPRIGQIARWRKRGFPMPAPNAVKWAVLRRWGSASSPWIESGTYLGETTRKLSAWSPLVVTLEPDAGLFAKAQRRLRNVDNVKIINAPSEVAFPLALELVIPHRSANFWLDGHYSSENTFQGVQDTPVLTELGLISDALRTGSLESAVVFVDDCRLFAAQHREIPGDSERPGYPGLRWLTEWSHENQFSWRIEHDIFVAVYPPGPIPTR